MPKSIEKDQRKLVEIVRSFSYKMNLGDFQNVDFFCSQKAAVPVELAEKTSEIIYKWCKREVAKSVKEFQPKTWLQCLEEKEKGLEQQFNELEENAISEDEKEKAEEQLPIIEAE